MFEAAIFLIVVMVILLSKMIRIVPQGEEWVVERFGRFSRVLKPGLRFINPIISKVNQRHYLRYSAARSDYER